MWFPVQKLTYHVHSSATYDSIPDPADLDLDEGYSEPDLCFSRSKVRDPANALLDSGATHVLLPGHTLPKGARSFEVTVNLAVGKEKAKCWRNEVYAEDRAHGPFHWDVPIWTSTNLLDTKFVWEDGTAVMQCRDKGKWRTMTKFEIRNKMAYASQMQFEVLRRALLVQQAQPQTVLNWQFWERAAHDPKMTAYVTHGVKAKVCETTPFVNTVGAHYVASKAQLELACDSLRQQGSSRVTTIGLSKVEVCADMTESPSTIAEALLVPEAAIWSTMVMHTHPFTKDILQKVHPYYEVLLSCKPHFVIISCQRVKVLRGWRICFPKFVLNSCKPGELLHPKGAHRSKHPWQSFELGCRKWRCNKWGL